MSLKDKVKIQCDDCGGTGLYIGLAERDGNAVVCNNCRGRGYIMSSAIPFTSKKHRHDVKRVFLPLDICVDRSSRGGVDYADWLKSESAVLSKGTEMRSYTCPMEYKHLSMSRNFHTLVDFPVKLREKCNRCVDFDCGNSEYVNFEDKCVHYQTKHKCWNEIDSSEEYNVI